VKFGPVKHGVAKFAKARRGALHGFVLQGSAVNHAKTFWKGGVEQSDALHGKALLRRSIVRHGTVESGLARLRAVGQGKPRKFLKNQVFSICGMEWRGGAKSCMVMCG